MVISLTTNLAEPVTCNSATYIIKTVFLEWLYYLSCMWFWPDNNCNVGVLESGGYLDNPYKPQNSLACCQESGSYSSSCTCISRYLCNGVYRYRSAKCVCGTVLQDVPGISLNIWPWPWSNNAMLQDLLGISVNIWPWPRSNNDVTRMEYACVTIRVVTIEVVW